MISLSFEADIAASAERVFSLLADLRNYAQWLPASSAFYGTSEISEGPVGVGTTYVERTPVGVRHGVVTALVRPTRLDFEQPMTLKPRLLGSASSFHTPSPPPPASFTSCAGLNLSRTAR